VSSQSVAAGEAVLVGSLGLRGAQGGLKALELALQSHPDEKRWFVQFQDGSDRMQTGPVSFSVSVPPGKYYIFQWSLSEDGELIAGGSELLAFEAGKHEVVCLGDLFPVAIKRDRVQMRGLASDAGGCAERSRSLSSTFPALQGRPLRLAYQPAYPEGSPTLQQTERGQSTSLPIVLTAGLGRYLVKGASMVDAMGSLVKLAPGVVTRPTGVSVRICVSPEGRVNHIKILDSNDSSVEPAMEHYLKSRPYEALPLGSPSSPFCYVDRIGTMPAK
jgi:hypothetical protein